MQCAVFIGQCLVYRAVSEVYSVQCKMCMAYLTVDTLNRAALAGHYYSPARVQCFTANITAHTCCARDLKCAPRHRLKLP